MLENVVLIVLQIWPSCWTVTTLEWDDIDVGIVTRKLLCVDLIFEETEKHVF